MRLVVKVPLLVVASMTVAAAAAGWSAVTVASQALEDQATEAARTGLDGYAATIEAYLDGAVALIEGGAADLGTSAPGLLDGAAAAESSRIVDTWPIFEHVALLDGAGSVRVVSPPSGSVAILDWPAEALRVVGTSISDLVISPFTRAPSVMIATPVPTPAGRSSTTLVGLLRLDAFSRVGRPEVGAGGDFYGYVTDRRGLVLGHQATLLLARFQTDFSTVPSVTAALAGRAGSGTWFNELEGERELGSYRPISGGWAAVYSTPASVALAPVRDLAKTLAILTGLAVVAVGTVGAALARRSVQPIQALATAATQIAHGDLGWRVPVTGEREVADLARRFNDMVDTLDRQDSALRDRAAELEAANAELDSFAYSVSHDLRAPLRSIDGFSKILLEDYDAALDDEGRSHLARVRQATTRMATLIDDMLGLSRIGRAELTRQEVDVSAVAAAVVADLRAADPGRDVVVDITPNLTVEADPHLLDVVVRNLIGNAWKFTAKTASARIWVGGSGPGVFHVRDNGAGFDMAYASKLFAPFHRLHADADFPGNGIGLATVQRIVRRHGGWIRADAEVDRGATFTFAFGPADTPENERPTPCADAALLVPAERP